MLPLDTKITDFPGLTPVAKAKLTPRANDLTKADLIYLARGEANKAHHLDLTLKDLKSVDAALAGYDPGQVAAQGEGGAACCCCCTPACCCCASAVVEPVKSV
jgi:hypothetical protein